MRQMSLDRLSNLLEAMELEFASGPPGSRCSLPLCSSEKGKVTDGYLFQGWLSPWQPTRQIRSSILVPCLFLFPSLPSDGWLWRMCPSGCHPPTTNSWRLMKHSCTHQFLKISHTCRVFPFPFALPPRATTSMIWVRESPTKPSKLGIETKHTQQWSIHTTRWKEASKILSSY
jgi:hypothetical protein